VKRIMLITFILLPLFVIGCATIISGTKQQVSVNSTPQSAEVSIKTMGGIPVFNGKTPASAALQRKNEYLVTVKMAGYSEQTVQISRTINTWVIGNLLCGGIPGLIVDGVTGALWNLDPEAIHVELVVAMQDGQPVYYAVLGMLDDEGQLRTLAVPMIPILN